MGDEHPQLDAPLGISEQPAPPLSASASPELAAPLPPGLPDAPPRQRLLWWQGALAMLVAIIMLVIANLGVAVVALLSQGGPADLSRLSANDAELTAALMSFPVLAAGQVANLLVFVTIALLAPFAARVPHRTALGLGGAPASVFVLGALGILGLSPLADLITRLLKPAFPEAGTLEMIEAALQGQPLYVLVPFLAVMPALGEELLCRGVLQRSIRSPWVALPVSALFFTALHFDPVHMAGVLPLGFYLAWLGYRSQSTWVPITAHFANNLTATLAMYAVAGAPLEATELPVWATPVGLLMTLACGYGLHTRLRRRPGAHPARQDQA